MSPRCGVSIALASAVLFAVVLGGDIALACLIERRQPFLLAIAAAVGLVASLAAASLWLTRLMHDVVRREQARERAWNTGDAHVR